jgi:hypothetical protein
MAATGFVKVLKTPTSCVFFQIFYPSFEKMEQPQTTKEQLLNMASNYTKTFF